MKSLLVVFLLCFVLMLQGARGVDPCTRGMDAIDVFRGMESCEFPDNWDWDMVGRLFDSSYNATVEDVRNVFDGYCRTVFPAMIQCFRGNIQNCSADQRIYLTSVLDQTGFTCEPNTANVHPHFVYLLSRFSDADLVWDDRDCLSFEFEDAVYNNCTAEALDAVRMTREELNLFFRTATIQELVPLVPVLMNGYMECFVNKIRTMPDRCPQWRGVALRMAMQNNVLDTFLGNTMTFTRSELAEMFGFQDDEPSGTTQSAQSTQSSQSAQSTEAVQPAQTVKTFLSIALFKTP